MIQINGHWENTDTLEDISKIIREYYNYELANELDKLIPASIDAGFDKVYVEGLEDIIDQIRSLVY